MRGWKVSVQPKPGGKFNIRMQALDDAGHLINHWFSVGSRQELQVAVQKGVRAVQVLASEVTEEETFDLPAQGKITMTHIKAE